jgi:hypothetical protein
MSRKLSSFRRRSWQERLLVARAALLLAVVRVALRLLPFHTVQRMAGRLARSGRDHGAPQEAGDQILWALSAASRVLPGGATCLTQALAGYVWLGRKGRPADLRIGVARGSGGRLLAHAWLQSGDRMVLGHIGAEHERYTPLAAFRAPTTDSGGSIDVRH